MSQSSTNNLSASLVVMSERGAEEKQQYQLEAVEQLVPKEYKQTEVGVIPKDWEVAKVGDVCDLLTGFPFPSKKYTNSGVRLLRGSNVKRNHTDWSDSITQYWPEINVNIRQYELQGGDIVISMDGSLVGRSFAQLRDSDLPAILLQRVARLRSISVSQNYLKEWVCSNFFTEHCDSVKTVTAIPHISPQDIKSFKFLLPPTKKEQTAIANALSDVDALLNELEKLIAKKQAMKTATMQQLLNGRTRLPQFALREDGSPKNYKQSELGDIPEDWNLAPFGSMLSIRHGRSQRGVESEGGSYPILATGGQIGWATNYLWDQPSVLIGRKGTIDKPRYIDEPFWTVDTLFYSEIKEKADAKFVYYKFCVVDWRQYNEASGVPSLNGSTIESVYSAIPEKDEQTAIATILSDIDEEIQALKKRLNKTRQIKQGMMQELLTGKTRLVAPQVGE